jgi:hypothetical protein
MENSAPASDGAMRIDSVNPMADGMATMRIRVTRGQYNLSAHQHAWLSVKVRAAVLGAVHQAASGGGQSRLGTRR